MIGLPNKSVFNTAKKIPIAVSDPLHHQCYGVFHNIPINMLATQLSVAFVFYDFINVFLEWP
jgi:hypothetical protein